MDKCCQVQGNPSTSKTTEKTNGGNSLEKFCCEEKQRKGGLAWKGTRLERLVLRGGRH